MFSGNHPRHKSTDEEALQVYPSLDGLSCHLLQDLAKYKYVLARPSPVCDNAKFVSEDKQLQLESKEMVHSVIHLPHI